MFGKRMQIQGKAGLIQLKPFTKDEISKRVIDMLAEHVVTRYTMLSHAPTIEDEGEWYEKIRKSEDRWLWGIYCDESPLLGFTEVNIQVPNHLGTTGFMLFDQAFWGKGIASGAHIARTHYAVSQLDLKTLGSGVLSPNKYSKQALERVGYFVTGLTIAERYRDGIYRHHIHLQWIRPGYEDLLFADENTPDEIWERSVPAIERAKIALQRGSREVVFY